jgi:hypothetical protein
MIEEGTAVIDEVPAGIYLYDPGIASIHLDRFMTHTV